MANASQRGYTQRSLFRPLIPRLKTLLDQRVSISGAIFQHITHLMGPKVHHNEASVVSRK